MNPPEERRLLTPTLSSVEEEKENGARFAKRREALHELEGRARQWWCLFVAAASVAIQAAAAIPDRVDSRAEPGLSQKTVLGIKETTFTINGQPVFLYGISYYGALGASEEFIRRDLDDMRRFGFNWIRVWANWGAFTNDVAIVDADGNPRAKFLEKLKWLVAECDRRGMVVDVSFSRGNGIAGPPRLQSLAAHQRAVETVVRSMQVHRNWYLDLSNERNIQDKRFTSFADLAALRKVVRELDRDRLVSASHAGDIGQDDLREYLQNVSVDFIAPHRPRRARSAGETETKTKEYLGWMRQIGRAIPVHYQEPFRRGFRDWQPEVEDFSTDALGAQRGGAAGWCFHNGDTRGHPDGKPRRSFDVRERRLFDQLDEVEQKAIEERRKNFEAVPKRE